MDSNNVKQVKRERDLLLHYRPPAKNLDDILLDDKIYKADFEIGEKYSSFSSEIIRLTFLPWLVELLRPMARYPHLTPCLYLYIHKYSKNKKTFITNGNR